MPKAFSGERLDAVAPMDSRQDQVKLRDFERCFREIGQTHVKIVRVLEGLPQLAFHPVEQDREQAIMVDVSNGHRFTIERSANEKWRHGSITIRVEDLGRDGSLRERMTYQVSYPYQIDLHGATMEDGLHLSTPEQRSWDYKWKEFQRALLQHRTFCAALESALHGPVVEGSVEDRARVRIEQLLKAEVVVTDATAFVDEMKSWWDIAHLKKTKAFPEKDIPRTEKARPPDRVISHEQLAERQRSTTNRMGKFVYLDQKDEKTIPYTFHIDLDGRARLVEVNGRSSTPILVVNDTVFFSGKLDQKESTSSEGLFLPLSEMQRILTDIERVFQTTLDQCGRLKSSPNPFR